MRKEIPHVDNNERRRFDELINVEIERRKWETKANELRHALGLGIIPGTTLHGMKPRGRKAAADDPREDWEIQDQGDQEGRVDTLGRRIGTRVLSPAARLKMSQAAKSRHVKEAGEMMKKRDPASYRTKAQLKAMRKNAALAREALAKKKAGEQGISKPAAKSIGGEWTPARRRKQAKLMRARNRRMLIEGKHSSQKKGAIEEVEANQAQEAQA